MDVATGKLHIFKGCRHVQNGMTRRSHCGPALDGLDPSASQSCLTEDLSENGVPPNLRVNHMKSPLLQYGHFLSLPRFQTHTHTHALVVRGLPTLSSRRPKFSSQRLRRGTGWMAKVKG